MKITSRFKVLLAEKAVQDGRTITLRDVATETGISIYTVTGFANNTLREFPLEALVKLCAYLGCGTGDLLVYSADGVIRPLASAEQVPEEYTGADRRKPMPAAA